MKYSHLEIFFCPKKGSVQQDKVLVTIHLSQVTSKLVTGMVRYIQRVSYWYGICVYWSCRLLLLYLAYR